jgi:hypothetical protein
VDAKVKAGLLALVAHATSVGGWSGRKAAAALGLEHTRLMRWQARAGLGRLEDAKPGPEVPLHAILGWERKAICTLAEQWGEVDRSHRKLAHRGARLIRASQRLPRLRYGEVPPGDGGAPRVVGTGAR